MADWETPMGIVSLATTLSPVWGVRRENGRWPPARNAMADAKIATPTAKVTNRWWNAALASW